MSVRQKCRQWREPSRPLRSPWEQFLFSGKGLIVGRRYIIAGQSDVWHGIAGILFNGLVEVVLGFFQRFRRALLPLVTALEIELVGLRIAGPALGHLFRGFARQALPQLGGDGAGDFLLH